MLNSLTAEVLEILSPSAKGKTLIITIGNTLRSDDAVGPYIAEKFSGSEKYALLNAADKPENAIDKAVAIKPAKTVIIDAADFGGSAGEARVIPNDIIPDTTLSTHTFPLKVIAKILEEDTGSKVYFLGIQPKSVMLGEEMCEEVRGTANAIIENLRINSRFQ